jgi:hypothetical protein
MRGSLKMHAILRADRNHLTGIQERDTPRLGQSFVKGR